MITVWGNADSINVQKVLWLCEEMAVQYRNIDPRLEFGAIRTPALLAINPNGLVPTIDDDGFVVWESNTIVRYLAAKYSAGQLWPTEAKLRADADRWIDWTNSTLWPTMVPLFRAFFRTAESERDAQAISIATQETIDCLSILNTHLGSNEYVGGQLFSMGDIALGCAAWRWRAMPLERVELRHVDRWLDRLEARPAYRKVVMLPLR
jgi:glutathione S-transferase